MRAPAVVLLLLCLRAPLAAQQVQTAVVPGSITVGDVFHAVIRVQGTGAARAVFPDSLVLPENLERVGRAEVRVDTVDGGVRWTASYPLTGWRPGTHALAATAIALVEDGTTRAASASFPSFTIGSVLPADTAGVQPQPPKDVLGADRLWWPLLLLALLLAVGLALLYAWYRRRRARRSAEVTEIVVLSPRAAALAALERARASGALERGEFKRFYTDVSEALRAFSAALDPRLGGDLTTRELASRVRWWPSEPTRDLIAVLEAADLVKFARRRPEARTAIEEWERARRVVELLAPADEERRVA